MFTRTVTTFARNVRSTTLQPMFSPRNQCWRLVPTDFNGLSHHYRWDDALPMEYATKREAIAAKRELTKDQP